VSDYLREISSALRSLIGRDQTQPSNAEREFRQFRKEALQCLLQTGSDNYKENARIAGVIEDKAQKAGAVAGIFLAAGLAFVKPGISLTELGGRVGATLLSASIALLLACIALCLAVMWARPGRSPLLLSDVQKMVSDIFAFSAAEFTSEIQEGFSENQAHLWAQTLNEQVVKNRRKALLLRRAQVTLALAMLLVGIFLFLLLLRAFRNPNLLPV
jgi:hypothetical protein